MRVKRILTLTLAAVLVLSLFTATALAGNGDKAANAAQRAQERLERLQEIQPLIDEVIANRAELQTLKLELAKQHAAANAHIAELKSSPDTVTDEQLAAAKDIKTQISQARSELKTTNQKMSDYRQTLKTARHGRDYTGVEAAYNNIISIQEQRINKIKALIELYKKAAAI